MLANLGDAVASLTKSSEDVDSKMAQAESGVRQFTESASTFRTSIASVQGAVDQSLSEMARTTNQLATALEGRCTEMESVIRDADEQLKGIQRSLEETRQLVSQHVQRITAGYDALKQRANAAPTALSQAVEHLGATQATVLARITQSLSALDTGAKKITTDIQAFQEAAHAERGRATQAVENLSKAIAALQPDVSAALASRSKDARVVVDALGDKLNDLLRENIHKPINDLRTQTRDALQKAVNEKTDEVTRRIIDEGLGFLLQGVSKAQEDSSGITRELKKLIPDQIDRARKDLGYILEHIDEILKVLGKFVTHKFEKAVDQGIDWLSEKTGVDLSGLKVVNHAVINNLNAGIDLVADSGKLLVDTFLHPENTLKNLKTVGKDVIQVVATFPPVALARTAVSAIAPKIAKAATAGFDAIGRHLPPGVKKALDEQAARARALVAQGASVLRNTIAQG
ncbi:MAG: hypothetical protein EB084_23525, partial [Proteobacteria bacterium]|nr:hypothetical protein [Pseudomonadota bacterium]